MQGFALRNIAIEQPRRSSGKAKGGQPHQKKSTGVLKTPVAPTLAEANGAQPAFVRNRAESRKSVLAITASQMELRYEPHCGFVLAFYG